MIRRILWWGALIVCLGAISLHAQTMMMTGAGLGAPGGGGGGVIAFVAAADGGNNSSSTSSLTFSYTVGSGSGRLLVVGVLGDSVSDLITGTTYNGSAMTLAAKLAPAGASNRWTYLFWQVGPTSGAHNVVVSASGTSGIFAGAADYTGVNAAGQPDATVTHAGAGAITTLTTSITTVANNSWAILIENGFDSPGNPPSAGAGLTLRAVDATFGAWGLFDSNGPITPAGSYSMTTTYVGPSVSIDHVAASFKP